MDPRHIPCRGFAATMVAFLVTVALSGMASAAQLQEEELNPSEIVFQHGKPVYYDGDRFVPVKTRKRDGETVYYRMVRYDDELGYVAEDGASVASQSVAEQYDSRPPVTRTVKYYGNGLYGPDYYSSPYNRDARVRYAGPGYVGACDWRGCKEIHYAPIYYYYP